MDLDALVALLERVSTNVYHLAAPAGVKPCIVYHTYGRNDVRADDRNFTLCRKVQLDILMVSESDTLADDVCVALMDAAQPYEFVDEFYDDEYAALRVILQLEVLC